MNEIISTHFQNSMEKNLIFFYSRNVLHLREMYRAMCVEPPCKIQDQLPFSARSFLEPGHSHPLPALWQRTLAASMGPPRRLSRRMPVPRRRLKLDGGAEIFHGNWELGFFFPPLFVIIPLLFSSLCLNSVVLCYLNTAFIMMTWA